MSSVSKRDALLDTAEALFVRDGFWGTTTASIAREAGVATGTLFTYFSSKDELIDEVYMRIKATAFASTSPALEPAPLSEDGFRLIMEKYIRWGCAHPQQYRLLLQLRQENVISQRVQEQVEEGGLSLLQQGIERGLIESLDPSFLYSMVAAQCEAAIQYALDHQLDAPEVEAFARQTSSLIWKFLTP